jgi:translocation and assembly module TamA
MRASSIFRILISCSIIAVLLPLALLLPFPAGAAGDNDLPSKDNETIPMKANRQESVQVRVEGLTRRELDNVQAALAVPSGLVRDGVVDQLWLRRFLRQVPQNVREALEPFGYYRPDVNVTQEGPDEGTYRVRVEVAPGKPVRVRTVDVRLDGPGSHEVTLTAEAGAFPLRPSDILRHDVYETAKGELKTKALELGYLDAGFSRHVIRVLPDRSEAEIELVLATGPRYRFGDVTISGAPGYPDQFLRRFVGIRRGDVFSYTKLGQTQFNFVNADRFKEVRVDARKDEAEGEYVPVEIKLAQSAQKRFRIGAGYGTDTGVRGSLRYQDVNVFSTGNEFRAELQVSERLQGLEARYTIPDSKDVDSLTAFRLGANMEETSDVTTRSLSTGVERTRSLGEGRLGTLYVNLLYDDSEAGDERTRSTFLIPGVRFSGRRYDNLVRTTKGFRYLLEARGSSQALGADVDFLQILGEGNVRIPLPWRLSFIGRAQVATTLQNRATSNFPISLRFFAGGDSSVRGYGWKTLGPKDDQGNVVGGNNLFVASGELERAIGADWGVAAFYDTGNAFNDWASMDLAQSVGIGVRYYTMVGPVRLDVARQVGVRKPDIRVHFTVGAEF